MSNFDRIIEKVIENEGGYVHDKHDIGSETKYGISKRTYPKLDIKNLTVDQAKDIYFDDWYLKWNIDEIESPEVAYKVLDAVINLGPGRLNLILNNLNLPKVSTSDRDLRITMFHMLNTLDPKVVIKQIKINLEKYYIGLVDVNPKYKKFLHGWLKRAYKEL